MDSRYFTLIKGDRDEILEAVHKAIVSYERKEMSYDAPLSTKTPISMDGTAFQPPMRYIFRNTINGHADSHNGNPLQSTRKYLTLAG
jgi:hypothetical protein